MTGKILRILLICFISAAAFCSDFQVVSVQGIGSSSDAALKDALSQAVQQVAGALISSEAMVKNDELVREEILTHSNGFVQKYEIIKPVHSSGNGTYSVSIKAWVVRQKLRERLRRSKLAQTGLDDMQNVWAQIESENSRKESAETFLIKFLSGLRKSEFLQPFFVDKNGKTGQNAVPHIIPTRNRNKVLVSIGVVLKVDRKKFITEVQPTLTRLLDKLCAEKAPPLKLVSRKKRILNTGFALNNDEILTVTPLPQRVRISTGKRFSRNYRPLTLLTNAQLRKCIVIALDLCRSREPHEPSFRRYYFPKTPSLVRFMNGCVFSPCSLVVSLKDKDGNVLRQHSMKVFSGYLHGQPIFSNCKNNSVYLISPEIMIGSFSSDHMPVAVKFEMNTSDVKNIKSMEVSITENQ